MASNDELLNQLHQFIAETLDFRPLVEVVPGLRGGLWDQRADGAAAYSAKGVPVIALDAGWERWPQEHLRYVFLHECAHHRLKHTNPAMRATATGAPGIVYERNATNEAYTKRIEQQADQVTASYLRGFEAWKERAQIRQLQKDVEFIKWALRQRGLVK